MIQSYEYKSFLNEKVIEFIPTKHWKVGNKINFSCPICGDGKHHKHRGWWYMDTCSYYCFNCGTGLPGIKFIEYLSGQNYDQIKREYLKIFSKCHVDSGLSARFEKPESEPSLFELKSIVKPEWKNPLSEKAKQYLDRRLVTKAPFFKDNLYSWESKKNQDYILIPWRLNGIDAYFQLNDFQKLGNMKYIFPKDKKKLVAGLDNVDVSWPYIIVFEGYFDSLFVKNGICSGTKAITEYQIKLIKERFPHHQICISFDNDQSGISSMTRMIQNGKDFKFFKWFNENTKAKDINDYVIEKNDVNIFSDNRVLERMIVDKLIMKMWLVKNNYWTSDSK